MLSRVSAVNAEGADVADAGELGGRVLAAPVRLDRDSPACDNSAMDGFAVRHAELHSGPLPIVGEAPIGEQPAELPKGAALRIFTGSPLPRGADTVLRLERGVESNGVLRLADGVQLAAGVDIRRQAENARTGDVALDAGTGLSAAATATLASIGTQSVSLYRRLRVTVIVTGNELESADERPLPPWRLRDSNGPTLAALLGDAPWVASVTRLHSADRLEGLIERLRAALSDADAVVLTGGVSKGRYDFVPEAITGAGGETVFHRIAARPGQPTLGAVHEGKPIVGLPGNPLSVLCAGRRLLVPMLRKRAGLAVADPPAPTVTLSEWAGKPQAITWWRPVTLTAAGVATLVSLRGSGDPFGPAASDGFVETPAGADGLGPYAYYPWRV